MLNPWLAGLLDGYEPKPKLSLSQWAEQHMVLPPERSASPGPYRIGDAEYQREWMDACTDPDVSSVILVTSSQVGKTTILQAAQGYYVDQEPSPQISVWPTDIEATKYVDETFMRFIEQNDVLNTVMDGLKYAGGYIAFVGGSNPRGLASRPIRVLTGDELDRWPRSAGREGSPIDVVRKRMTTFKNSKEILASTPLLLSTSTIVELFKESRQHYYHVVCDACYHSQVLKWEQVDFERGSEHKAVYRCDGPGCGTCWTEAKKVRLVREAPSMGGGWIWLKEAPFKCFQTDLVAPASKRGYWINEIYSPFSSMAAMALAHSLAGQNIEKQKVFRNTSLALPWEGDKSSVADADLLRQRREEYRTDWMPAEAAALTAAVDVQDDRLVVMVIAWGRDDEHWILKYHTIQLDPSSPRAWAAVTEELERGYPHPAGYAFKIEAVAIDSGGHFTQQVYRFSMMAQKRGLAWFAIRGVPGASKPLWELSANVRKKGVKLWLVGVDTGKETVYSRYSNTTPGPGYCHLNMSVTDKVIDEMTAEYAEIKYNNQGFPVKTWEKRSQDRNEGLDLMVYNLAVRSSLTIDMDRRFRSMAGDQAPLPTMTQLGELYRDLNGATSKSVRS